VIKLPQPKYIIRIYSRESAGWGTEFDTSRELRRFMREQKAPREGELVIIGRGSLELPPQDSKVPLKISSLGELKDKIQTSIMWDLDQFGFFDMEESYEQYQKAKLYDKAQKK